MAAEAFAHPIPVPAAIVPTPAIMAPSDAGVAAPTACQSTVVTRLTATTMLSAPNTQVAHRWTATSTRCPSPDTITVNRTNTAMQTMVSTGALFAFGSVPNTMANNDISAKAAGG